MDRRVESGEDVVAAEQETRHVRIGQYDVSSSAELVTYALGSCLGITLYDERVGIGGLIHAKRPIASEHGNSNDTIFVDTGVRELVEAMESQGAVSHRIEAKLIGGSNTTGAGASVNRNIGERNTEQAKETLSRLDITVTATAVGGGVVRSVFFDCDSGEVIVETATNDSHTI